METSKTRTRVLTGIFVLVAITILFAGIYVVGKKNNSFTKSIITMAYFDDVNGLARGNNVWFEGVKIGTVKNVVFAKTGVEVFLSIQKSVVEHLHMDTKAKLGSDGLIGNKIIILYGGLPSSPAIKENHIFTVEKTAGTEEILNTLQKSNQNLLAITDNFKLISVDLSSGKGTIGKLLTDETLINTLQATVVTLQKSSLNVQTLSSNLALFSDKLNNKGSLVNELVTDTTIFAALKITSVQLKQAAASASQLADNLKFSSEALRDTNGPAGVLLNDRQTADNIKTSMENLKSSSFKLDETMEALQHNFLVRGFFKKKAKAEAKKKNENEEAQLHN